MTKYQFFSQKGKERQDYTFLRMESDSFQEEKAQLFKMGLEVDGDVIFASSDKEANEKYKSYFVHLTEEMNDSHVESGLINTSIEIIKTIKNK